MYSRIRFSISTVLLFMIFGSACQTVPNPLPENQTQHKVLTKPPDWVLGKEHSEYSRNQYLVGVGFSDMNSVSASESARLSLAKNLKVKIRSTMVDVSTTEKTHIESVIKTEVDTVLEGVEIKDGWLDLDKGVYYALAVVERSLAASSIQKKIGIIESALQRNLNEGIEAENRADVITALSNYFSGYEKAPELPPLKSALHIITPSIRNTEPRHISADQFKSKAKNIINNLNLIMVSGDRQTVKNLKGLTEPLVAKVYLLKGENQVPVSNIPVIFNYEAGQGGLEGKKTSGIDGMVQTTIHKISSHKEVNHVVTVKLDYSSLIRNFNGEIAKYLMSPLKSKRISFYYTVQTPRWASSKSQAWRDSITDLGNQIISNIPPEKQPTLGVMLFKDLRLNQVTPFSRILNEDVKAILARAEDLKLKEIKTGEGRKPEEIAKDNGLDYYIVGSYRMERMGLEVRARLIDTQTKNIQSSANVLIDRKELNPEDLALIDGMSEKFKSTQKKKKYQEHLEKLIAAKPQNPSFNVKVWTDKKDYEIKEKIVFSVRAEKSGYLTMLDVNPNGDVTVIFPNKFHRDNFIRAGVIYLVPSPNYGFEFDIQGPAGLERIKAIVTKNNIPLLDLDLGNGFHTVKKETTRGNRAIQVLSKQIDSVDSSAWSEAYSEVFIFNEGKRYSRGSRAIRTPSFQ